MNTADHTESTQAGVATDPLARIAALDAVRGLAVCGIVLLNVYNFAMPPAGYFNPMAWGGAGPLPLAIWAVESIFAQDAFRAIFAMLFGSGFAILWDRGAGRRFRAHAARMAVLLVLGMAHALLLSAGDVLRLYAIVGLLLPLFLHLSQRGLLVAVAVCAVIHMVGLGLVFGDLLIQWRAAPDAAPTGIRWVLEAEFGTMPSAIEWGLMIGRETINARVMRIIGLWQDQLTILGLFAPQTLAAMLLGVWGWRGGLLRGRWKRDHLISLASACSVIALPVLMALCGWAFASDFAGVVVGSTALVWSQPFAIILGLAYTAALFSHWGRQAFLTGLGGRLAAAGRLSLTNYIGASILAGAIYARWGFGLFAQTDRVETTLIAFGIIATILMASPLWESRYGMGPLERLWRIAASGLAGHPRS